VLLDANLLVGIRNATRIAAVVFKGKLFHRTSLDAMLSNAEALASRKSIAEALAKTIIEKDVESAIKQYHELRATHSDASIVSMKRVMPVERLMTWEKTN
jgi:hypothetical protein